jgi:hypothetical protein
VKTIYRKSTLLLRMHVAPDADAEGLAEYWTKAPWGIDVKPVLEALRRVPGGAEMGVVNLLPTGPSGDLYSFPFPSSKPEDQGKDCHWTAFNFFNPAPDARFAGTTAVKTAAINKTLEEDYYPVAGDPRYGDLVELYRPNGDLVHSSVFIADDIVYTKNSPQFLEPFIFMKKSEMIDAISTNCPEDETLQVRLYRRKAR